MKKNDTQAYEAPQVDIIEVEVEKGFALSGGVNGSGIEDMPEGTW